LTFASKAVKVKLNRASDCLSMLRKVPGLLQEQHRGAALGLRENTAFARDSVHAGAGDPLYTPHLVSSVPQSNRNPEVPCEDTFPLSRQAPHELQPLNTDRWYYRVFQSAPDLIRSLLLGSAAAWRRDRGRLRR
jgi:hypothetical protein